MNKWIIDVKKTLLLSALVLLSGTLLEASAAQNLPVPPTALSGASASLRTMATSVLRSQGPDIAFPTAAAAPAPTAARPGTSYGMSYGGMPYGMQNADVQRALCVSQLLRSMTALVQEITGVLQRIEFVPGNTGIVLPAAGGGNTAAKSGTNPGQMQVNGTTQYLFTADGHWRPILGVFTYEQSQDFARTPPYRFAVPGSIWRNGTTPTGAATYVATSDGKHWALVGEPAA